MRQGGTSYVQYFYNLDAYNFFFSFLSKLHISFFIKKIIPICFRLFLLTYGREESCIIVQSSFISFDSPSIHTQILIHISTVRDV